MKTSLDEIDRELERCVLRARRHYAHEAHADALMSALRDARIDATHAIETVEYSQIKLSLCVRVLVYDDARARVVVIFNRARTFDKRVDMLDVLRDAREALDSESEMRISQ